MREILLIIACIVILVLVSWSNYVLDNAAAQKTIAPRTRKVLKLLLVFVPISGFIILPYYSQKNRG